MHEGPTENRLGELGSLYKYYYYYYYYYYKFLNCKVKLWGSKNIIHDGVKTKLLTRKK